MRNNLSWIKGCRIANIGQTRAMQLENDRDIASAKCWQTKGPWRWQSIGLCGRSRTTAVVHGKIAVAGKSPKGLVVIAISPRLFGDGAAGPVQYQSGSIDIDGGKGTTVAAGTARLWLIGWLLSKTEGSTWKNTFVREPFGGLPVVTEGGSTIGQAGFVTIIEESWAAIVAWL